MCQAYDGEQRAIFFHERFIRKKGFEAFHSGISLEDCPEADHPNPQYSDRRQWGLGWETAKEGRECW